MNNNDIADYLLLDNKVFLKDRAQPSVYTHIEEPAVNAQSIPIILFDNGVAEDVYLTLSSVARFVRPISEIYILRRDGTTDNGLSLKEILSNASSSVLWWPAGTGVIRRIETDSILRRDRKLIEGRDGVLSKLKEEGLDIDTSSLWDGTRPQRISAEDCLHFLSEITVGFTQYLDRICTLLMHFSGKTEEVDTYSSLNINRCPLDGMAYKRLNTYTFIRWNARGLPCAYELVHTPHTIETNS